MTDPLTQANASAGLEPGVIPYIVVERATEAIAFYKQAFAAQEVGVRPTEDGKRVMHAQLTVNGGSIMLNDPFPEHGHPAAPLSCLIMQLLVDDAQAWFDRAVQAGCAPTMPVQLMFWGDKWGTVTDPFGVQWAFNESGSKGA
ncbi:MAG: VOC family protein [Caulobacteraceae bacterium]|nr:MAG: VOC family protein [Caulobacteraceae bacterium]